MVIMTIVLPVDQALQFNDRSLSRLIHGTCRPSRLKYSGCVGVRAQVD